MARFFASILGIIGVVLVIAVLLPQSKPPTVPNRQSVQVFASNAVGTSVMRPDANGGNGSTRGKAVPVGTANRPHPQTLPLDAGSNAQQTYFRVTLPVRGESGRKVAALTEAEELELLQIQMAYDRSNPQRDPKITERWFELRKQSRLLRAGMSRQKAEQLLGQPAGEDNTKENDFLLFFKPKPGNRRMHDSYENLLLRFDSGGRLMDWDWFSPEIG